jgi:hypothetical protein
MRITARCLTRQARPTASRQIRKKPETLVLFGIYCNSEGECGGQLSVAQIFSDMLRHCGDVFNPNDARIRASLNSPGGFPENLENKIRLNPGNFGEKP